MIEVASILLQNMTQGRNWLPKNGWASSNSPHLHCPVAPSILPKTGWAIAYLAHSPITPLGLGRNQALLKKIFIWMPQRDQNHLEAALESLYTSDIFCNLVHLY